jgi:hypothetical protein
VSVRAGNFVCLGILEQMMHPMRRRCGEKENETENDP